MERTWLGNALGTALLWDLDMIRDARPEDKGFGTRAAEKLNSVIVDVIEMEFPTITMAPTAYYGRYHVYGTCGNPRALQARIEELVEQTSGYLINDEVNTLAPRALCNITALTEI